MKVLFALAALALPAAALAQDAAPVRVPLNGETEIGGVGFACTGIGQTRHDPKWLSWPVRMEFAAPGGDLLGDGVVAALDARGHSLGVALCEGPWILVRPTAATARLSAWLPGDAAKRQTFAVPRGQGQRVIGVFFKPGGQ